MRPVVLVSGKNGQLGTELKKLSAGYPAFQFVFFDRSGLDITDPAQVRAVFDTHQPRFFINTAAYTAVDKAETDQESAYAANAAAVGIVAAECDRHDATLLSFSTDYVFNGEGPDAYTPGQPTEPLNYYGYTKAQGEQLALANCGKTIVIRTSWVYSAHGHNFVKTMLRLMKEKTDINVVNDQLGSPTYAADLAEATLRITAFMSEPEPPGDAYGIYHFSNKGVISWFDFATEIKKRSGSSCNIHPVPSSAFPTPAKRPHYSVLDNTSISRVFGIGPKDWQDSLGRCMKELGYG